MSLELIVSRNNNLKNSLPTCQRCLVQLVGILKIMVSHNVGYVGEGNSIRWQTTTWHLIVWSWGGSLGSGRGTDKNVENHVLENIGWILYKTHNFYIF